MEDRSKLLNENNQPVGSPTSCQDVDMNSITQKVANTSLDPAQEANWGGDDAKSNVDDEKTTSAEHLNESDGPQGTGAVSLGEDGEPKKKKKKKKKSKSKRQRGLNKPTGFEEYYVDPPVTPQEHEEELDLYDKSRPFAERIETAIQRYRARRKLDSERANLFDKYMSYGGVDSGPKMFGGNDMRSLGEQDSAAIAAATATNFVASDKTTDDAKFVVDFDGCLKGFLSSWLPQCFDIATEKQARSYTAVIRNFLNYLLYHDVCPEYVSQIHAARLTCDIGERQLWDVSQAAAWLPGDFNTACSTLFGGYYENIYAGDQEWARGLDLKMGMSKEQARKVLKAGLAANGTDEMIQKFKTQAAKSEIKSINVTNLGLEVVELSPAEKDVKELYTSLSDLWPLGKIRLREWHNPANPPEDLTDEERLALTSSTTTTTTPPREFVLFLEDIVLEKCFVGMKFDATIRELSFGIEHLDTITGVYCSFYDILPNELMMGWREHVYLEPREKMNQEAGEEKEEEGEGEDGNGSEIGNAVPHLDNDDEDDEDAPINGTAGFEKSTTTTRHGEIYGGEGTEFIEERDFDEI